MQVLGMSGGRFAANSVGATVGLFASMLYVYPALSNRFPNAFPPGDPAKLGREDLFHGAMALLGALAANKAYTALVQK